MFKPEEKEIFSYTLPDLTIKCDPLRIQRRLGISTSGGYDELFEQAEDDGMYDQEQIDDTVVRLKRPDFAMATVKRLEAMGKLIAAASFAFSLPQYDPKTEVGYTEDVLWNLVIAFDDWIQKKSQNTKMTVIAGS